MHGQVGAYRQGADASRQIGGIQLGGIVGPAHGGGEGTLEFLLVLGLAHAAAGGVQLGAAHGLHGIAVIGLQGIAGRQARDVEDRQRERQQHQHQQRRLAQQGGYEGRHDILRSA